MNLYSAGKIAYRALRANKMRSVLTMLGMIIGVAAVIAAVGGVVSITHASVALAAKTFPAPSTIPEPAAVNVKT